MNYAYLRTQNGRFSLVDQEIGIESHAKRLCAVIKEKKVETSSYGILLEKRKDFIEFIHSLKSGDLLFVYDLSLFSHRIGELVRIVNCILKSGAEICISRFDIKINYNTPTETTLKLLNEVRENCSRSRNRGLGRPRGTLSRSKYDVYKKRILECLKEGKSVAQIAKELNVSRSSLRDYINSRNLKDLAAGPAEVKREGELFVIPNIECKIEKKG